MHSRLSARGIWLVLLLTLAVGLLFWSALRRGDQDPVAGALSPDTALLTPAIRAAGELQRALLAQDTAPALYAEELATYNRLWLALLDPNSRDAAEQELFERWEAQPGHLLWIETAILNYRLLTRRQEYTRLWKLAAGEDSTSAVARYVYARRFHGRRADARDNYLLAEQRQLDLDPLQRLWLQASLSTCESGAGDHDQASQRLLALLPEVWRLGGAHLAANWWRWIAAICRADGRLDDALQAADWARICAERAGLPALAIQASLERGHALESRRELLSAERVYQRCRQEARDGGFLHFERTAVAFLGLVHSMRGDLPAEMASLRQSLDLAYRMRDNDAVLRSSTALADCMRRIGTLDSTRVLLEVATRLLRET